MIWFLLFLATAIEVTGTLCLRMSAVTGRRMSAVTGRRFWVVLVALCYVSAYGFWRSCLRPVWTWAWLMASGLPLVSRLPPSPHISYSRSHSPG